MLKNNYITIPEPCSKDWQEMTVAEKGRFCTSCQKNVFDFTNSSDREIAAVFNNNKSVCGRFNVSQLDRELIVPKEKNPVWMIAATGVIGFLGLGNNGVYAQGEIKVEQTDAKKRSDGQDTIHQEKDSIEVTGTIYDDSNIPLPGTIINIKETLAGTQTDINGNYKIRAKEGNILVFSYLGFKTKEVAITSMSKNITINLNLDEDTLTMGLVMYTKKRTFFGRIFHGIGNIFR